MWSIWLGCLCMSKYECRCISWQWVLFILYFTFWHWYFDSLCWPYTKFWTCWFNAVCFLLFPMWFFEHYLFHSDIGKHTLHNYLFEVTPDTEDSDVHFPVFDAAHLGNATRFLNHRGGGKDNVVAKSMSSNISQSRMTNMCVESYIGHWRAPNWLFHKWVSIDCRICGC